MTQETSSSQQEDERKAFLRQADVVTKPLRRSVLWRTLLFFALAQMVLFLALGALIENHTTEDVGSNPVARTLRLALQLREYGARVAGVIPAPCALINFDDSELVSAAKELPPLAVSIVSPDNGCDWRSLVPREPSGNASGLGSSIWSRPLLWVAAAFSLEVSFIQKATLFAFIFGCVLLNRLVNERSIDRVVLEGRDKPSFFGGTQPLIPTNAISLGAGRTSQTAIATYITDHRTPRAALDKIGFSHTPIHIAVEVAETGRASGSAGAAQVKLGSQAEKHFDNLIARFWRVDYVVWLLPTIGFLGTIYGISLALLKAKDLFPAGGPPDPSSFGTSIGGVIDGLGLAFDTTAWALLLVAVLYWMQKHDESEAEELSEDTYRTLNEELIPKLASRPPCGAENTG